MIRRVAFALLAIFAVGTELHGDDWPQWMGPNRDGMWKETNTIDAFPASGAVIKWRTPVGLGYSGPAVVKDRVFVTDYVTNAGLTNDFSKRAKLEGKERILCLDAKTGEKVWSHDYDCVYELSYPGGPRCTPTVHDGKVYTLGAEGNLFCLNAENGKVIWSKDLKKEYNTQSPIWGYCGHPLIYQNKLICLAGGKDSVVVAFDKDSGKELWHSLNASEIGYAPPTLIEQAGVKQVVIWHADACAAVDPDTGKELWSVKLKPNYGMSIMTPVKYKDLLYVGGIINKGMCLKLDSSKPGATVAWEGDRDTGIYCKTSSPLLVDDHMYGVDMNGELRCVEIETGKRKWETFSPTSGKSANSGTGFLVKNGEKFFIFAETGELVIAKLSPRKYEEVSRAKILEPTSSTFGRKVVWTHPAFAGRKVYARNDQEIVCVDLAK